MSEQVENTADSPPPPAEIEDQTEVTQPPPEAQDPTPADDPPPEDAEARKQFDKDRQKADQERANSEKRLQAEKLAALEKTQQEQAQRQAEQDARMERMLAALESKAQPAPQSANQQAAKDDLAEVEELLDLSNKVARGESDDPRTALEIQNEANRKLLALQRKQRDEAAARQRDEQQRQTAAEKAADAERKAWEVFTGRNPEVPLAKARELRDEAWRTAGEEIGPDGKRLDGAIREYRMNQLFAAGVADLKKAPPSTQTPPKTAPSTRASTPPGVQVVPVDPGARKEPQQIADVARNFSRAFGF